MCAHTHICNGRRLCVCSSESAATIVPLCDIFGWLPLPKTLLQGEEVLLAVQGSALPYILWGNRVMHLHNPAPKTRIKCQDYSPPWGFCHTPMQGILMPEYPTPAGRLQRYIEFAGRNTTKWDHCIWKCVFSCPKSSVHMQNCKGYTYKP